MEKVVTVSKKGGKYQRKSPGSRVKTLRHREAICCRCDQSADVDVDVSLVYC